MYALTTINQCTMPQISIISTYDCTNSRFKRIEKTCTVTTKTLFLKSKIHEIASATQL